MTKLAQQQPRTRRHTQDSEKNRRVPSLRLHKASGRAYVVLSGKAVYCGRYGDPEAQAQLSPRKTPSGSSDEMNSLFRTGVREQSRQVPGLKLDRFRPDVAL
jgi:hypothetical protein